MPKPRQTTYDIIRAKAAQGNLAGVIESLSGAEPMAYPSTSFQARAIRDAITAAQQKGKAVDEALRASIANVTELLARALILLNRRVAQGDANPGGVHLDIPLAAVTELDRVVRLQERLVALARAQASLRHVDALSRRRRSPSSSKVVQFDQQATAHVAGE